MICTDECYINGDSGRCGVQCTILGQRDCCFDGWSLLDLVEAYDETENEYVGLRIDELKGKTEDLI